MIGRKLLNALNCSVVCLVIFRPQNTKHRILKFWEYGNFMPGIHTLSMFMHWVNSSTISHLGMERGFVTAKEVSVNIQLHGLLCTELLCFHLGICTITWARMGSVLCRKQPMRYTALTKGSSTTSTRESFWITTRSIWKLIELTVTIHLRFQKRSR